MVVHPRGCPSALAFSLVALGLLTSCESRVSLGGTCRSDGECGELRCLYGRCRAECGPGRECGGSLMCNEGVCAEATETCSPTLACSAPMRACAGTICAPVCGSGDLCDGDAVCTERLGARVCVPRGRADAGTDDAGAALSLTVRVQSGLRAGYEMRFAEAELFRGSVSCAEAIGAVGSEALTLEPGDQVELGRGTLTLGVFPALESGTYTVRVRARRPVAGSPDPGAVLGERCVVTSLASDRVLRVVLSSSCLGVVCPASGGSAAFDQCFNGSCVDPRCDVDDPATAEFCCDRTMFGSACDGAPTGCRTAADCPSTLGCSDSPRCEDGACIDPAMDVCSEGDYCDASSRSCVPEPALVTPDAGPRDAG